MTAAVTPGGPPALELQALDVPFGAAPAAAGLRGISLQIAPGERVAIVGPSGAGKTTLLRAIAGLTPTTGGVVRGDGADMTGAPPERRGCAYLHQSPVLFPHLDVFENIAFPLRVRRVSRQDVAARVASLLALLQLDGLGGRRTDAVSGGQRHRIALARALAADPRALLLDEPLAALDPTLRDDVRETLARLSGPGLPALLLVTHDFDDAALLADRVLVLLDGSIAQDDQPARLFARPATLAVARFLGIPNQLPAVVGGEHVHSAFGTVPLGVLANAEDAARMMASDRATERRLTLVAAADAVRLTPPGTGVDARVGAVRVRSARTTVLVEIDRASPDDEPVIVECAVERHGHPGVGARVGVSLDASRALVYPDR